MAKSAAWKVSYLAADGMHCEMLHSGNADRK